MKISNEQIQQMMQTYGVKGVGKVQKAEKTEAVSKAAEPSLSLASQEISKALGVIAKTSDVRADKVAALKAQIEAGTYQISGSDIAESILARKDVE